MFGMICSCSCSCCCCCSCHFNLKPTTFPIDNNQLTSEQELNAVFSLNSSFARPKMCFWQFSLVAIFFQHSIFFDKTCLIDEECLAFYNLQPWPSKDDKRLNAHSIGCRRHTRLKNIFFFQFCEQFHVFKLFWWNWQQIKIRKPIL